jgi:excisionase family DNA binding protein
MRSRTPLLTIEDVAELLSVRPGYVRRLVRERRIPYVKVGKLLRFDPGDLEEWLEAGRVEPHPR